MSLFCNFIKTVKKQCFFINDKLSERSRIGLNTLHSDRALFDLNPQKSHTLTSVIKEFTFRIFWKEIYLLPSDITVSDTYQKNLFKKMTYIIDCVHNLKCYNML